MRDWIKNLETKTETWMTDHASGTGAQIWLSLLSFFEASLLPVPPMALLVPMIVLGNGKRSNWIYLALLTTVTSVLGALFGYIIGFALYDTLGIFIINTYGLADEIQTLSSQFSDNAFLALFMAAFTPIPYKAFTIASGFFSINLVTFTVAGFIGRGLRYFIVAILSKFFGIYIVKRVFRYFAITTVVAILIIVGFVVLVSF